jgi:hypothetical protein
MDTACAWPASCSWIPDIGAGNSGTAGIAARLREEKRFERNALRATGESLCERSASGFSFAISSCKGFQRFGNFLGGGIRRRLPSWT